MHVAVHRKGTVDDIGVGGGLPLAVLHHDRVGVQSLPVPVVEHLLDARRRVTEQHPVRADDRGDGGGVVPPRRSGGVARR